MMSGQASQKVIKETNKLIGKAIIEHTDHVKGDFISPIFFCSNSDETSRLLKTFKELLEYNHFKMGTVHSVADLIQPQCYMTRVEVKDAYYLAKIPEEGSKYLKLNVCSIIFLICCAIERIV